MGPAALAVLSCAAPEVARAPDPAPAVAPAMASTAPPPPLLVVALALGESTTCVRRDDGRVACRGTNALDPTALGGPLAVDDTSICGRAEGRVRCIRSGMVDDRATPFVELTHGGGVPCGRDAAGAVFCLVGRDRDEASARVRPVPLPDRAVRVVADAERACALLADGRLLCWDPFDAMVRDVVPREVDRGVRGIDASYLQTCWWTESSVRCEPGRRRKLDAVEAVAVGRAHACALAKGDVTCWGAKQHGQTRVPEDLGSVVALDAGDDHTCALRADGDVQCWGRNDHGQAD